MPRIVINRFVFQTQIIIWEGSENSLNFFSQNGGAVIEDLTIYFFEYNLLKTTLFVQARVTSLANVIEQICRCQVIRVESNQSVP